MKKNAFSFLLFLIFLNPLAAQQKETLYLTPTEIEGRFIEQNLELIASKLNIDIAEAEIIQAKKWENPSLSIDQVNLWSTKSQREGEDEVIPPLFGSFAKNTEFSIELSQLIQTAGKRGKLVNMHKISKEIAIAEFEELLWGLKTELRKSIYEIIYLQSYSHILLQQAEYLSQLIEGYQKQAEAGNISLNELIRLQASLLEIETEIYEIETELNEQQKTLSSFLNLPPYLSIVLVDEEKSIASPTEILLAECLEIAEENRADLKNTQLQIQYFEKAIRYEKAQRVPDLTVNAAYDRYGGVWKDFIGVGVSMDLPVFDRNQGNIKAAQISKKHSEILSQHYRNTIHNEIALSINNYMRAYALYEKTQKSNLGSELEKMLESYTKNLLNRNISMLEYMDFIETYKTNQNNMLTSYKNLYQAFEELQYSIGTELK